MKKTSFLFVCALSALCLVSFAVFAEGENISFDAGDEAHSGRTSNQDIDGKELRVRATNLLRLKMAGVLPLSQGSDFMMRHLARCEIEKELFRGAFRSYRMAQKEQKENAKMALQEREDPPMSGSASISPIESLLSSVVPSENAGAGQMVSPITSYLRAQERKQELFFDVKPGTAVCAAKAGEVIGVELDPGEGHMISMDHGNDVITTYRGLGMVDVMVGDYVEARGRLGLAARRVVSFSIEQNAFKLSPAKILGIKN